MKFKGQPEHSCNSKPSRKRKYVVRIYFDQVRKREEEKKLSPAETFNEKELVGILLFGSEDKENQYDGADKFKKESEDE